jgi:hypothetical protein
MPLNLFQAKNDLRYCFSESGITRGPLKLGQLLELVESDTLVYGEETEWNTSKGAEEIQGTLKRKHKTSKLNSVFGLLGTQNEGGVGTVRMFAAPLPFKIL